MSLWVKPEYPGAPVRILNLKRGDELGDIRIQGGITDRTVKVCSFLPGVEECSPGDTPKVWPEKSEYVTNNFAADQLFDQYVGEAYEEGWQNG